MNPATASYMFTESHGHDASSILPVMQRLASLQPPPPLHVALSDAAQLVNLCPAIRFEDIPLAEVKYVHGFPTHAEVHGKAMWPTRFEVAIESWADVARSAILT